MATISSFTPKVLRKVPGCPEFLIEEAIIDALIDFCEGSLYWQADLTAIDIVSGTSTYTPTTPTDTLMVTVVKAFDEGQPIELKSEDSLDRDWPKLNWRYPYYTHDSGLSTPWRSVTSSQADFIYMPTPRTVRLVGIPDTSKTGGLTLKVALKPTRTATTVDDVLYDEWYEEIAMGAAGKLQVMEGKAWTMLGVGTANLIGFEAAIRKARGKVNRSHIRNTSAVGRTRGYY